MIVVTGATGKLGRLILEQLLARVPADQIAASARDPGKARDLAKQGVRVRRGDFSEPSSLTGAFENVQQLLLVSSNAQAYGGNALAQHRTAIDAAIAAGVRRIVYTSHMGVSATSAFTPMHDHAATEAMIRGAGVAWTALRNGFYASTVPTLMGDAAATGILEAPEDGKVCWTAHRDLAEAAAAILTTEGSLDGPTPPLTASHALDLQDVAKLLTDVAGRPVRRQVISDTEQAERMAGWGVPAVAIKIALGIYRAARANEFAAVDPALASLLGREPTSLHEVLAAGDDR